MTTEDFRKKKEAYNAKYGYKIHIPGFDDIFKWDTTPEPTQEELEQYRKKDVFSLGEVRFEAIKRLMAKKRENFLRILSSPAPDIVQNATSILTALDDVNDTLGTFVVVGRIAARRLPSIAFKLFAGPAGWALTAADIAGLALDLTRTPFKSRNIQHEINETVRDHPFSKKAKIRRLNKIKRLKLTKGEIIEGLQTTENMFGIGISLGPIFSLLTDIPSGLYRHAKGEKVTLVGLPAPLLWFDKIWSKMLKHAAYLSTGIPIELDQEMTKSMVASNLAIEIYRAQFSDMSPFDVLPELDEMLLSPAVPEHPSTKLVVANELGSALAHTGWPFSSHKYISPKHIFEEGHDHLWYNIRKWRERNSRDLEAMVGAQNAGEAGLNIMGALEGDDALDLEYEPVAMSILALLNQGYRFPPDVTQAQLDAWAGTVDTKYLADGKLRFDDALDIAAGTAGFDFTTEVSGRSTPTYATLMGNIGQLTILSGYWHRDRCISLASFNTYIWASDTIPRIDKVLTDMNNSLTWLNTHGWPPDEPTRETRDAIAQGRVRLWNRRTQLKTPGAPRVEEPKEFPVLVIRIG